jgi:hypothetical protein
MSVPMRKDELELEEELTTADLAQGKRPAAADRLDSDPRNDSRPGTDARGNDLQPNEARPNEARPRPVLAGRPDPVEASTQILQSMLPQPIFMRSMFAAAPTEKPGTPRLCFPTTSWTS